MNHRSSIRKEPGPRAPVATLAVTAVGVHLVPGFLLAHAFSIGLVGIDLGAGAAHPGSHDVPRARVEADLSAIIIGASVTAVVLLAALQRRHPPLARAVLAVEALIAGTVFSFFSFLVRGNVARAADETAFSAGRRVVREGRDASSAHSGSPFERIA